MKALFQGWYSIYQATERQDDEYDTYGVIDMIYLTYYCKFRILVLCAAFIGFLTTVPSPLHGLRVSFPARVPSYS